MADITIIVIDNSDKVMSQFERACKAGLEACGNQAVTHAKQTIAERGRIATGNLWNRIDHKVSGKVCYVGTNVSYAKYHEMGTGIYRAGGRKSPWAYQDPDGKWHWTRGIPPIYFIKKACADHTAEYRSIIGDELRKVQG